jgi:uncharacterized phiE125 gp8 family phage protein
VGNNIILSVQDKTVDAIVEPVTVQEVKDWLRLEGFTAVGGTELAFNDDNTLIGIIITAVREKFEKICGLTLTAARIKEVVLTNQCGMIELPFGPIKEITAAVDEDGTNILSECETVGNMWKYLKEPEMDNMVITYTAGYGSTGLETLPAEIKLDMLKACAYHYTHRGDDPAVQKFVSLLAYKYTRNLWLA